MQLYAIPVIERNAPLLALLNQGVAPDVEDVTTYLVIDATWNSDVPNRIMTEDEMFRQFNGTADKPLIVLTLRNP